jgi:putative membrane protein
MHPIAVIAALVAAAIHVMFFVMESVQFEQPRVHRRFGLETPEQVAAVRPMAFNQGFYNLFLAAGVGLGLALVATGSAEAGRAIVLFACACMVGAGLVLLATSRRFARASLIQAGPPAIAIVIGLIA